MSWTRFTPGDLTAVRDRTGACLGQVSAGFRGSFFLGHHLWIGPAGIVIPAQKLPAVYPVLCHQSDKGELKSLSQPPKAALALGKERCP